MNRQEFKQIYDLLDAVYELDFEPRKLDAWYEALKRYDAKKMTMAANQYIETEKYKPKPADLIKISAEIRPPVINKETFKCGLCASGWVLVEQLIDTADGKQPAVFSYRCKCDVGQRNAASVPSITDDILISRHRDVFGIYRIEPSKLTEVKREDMRKVAQNFGRW